MVVWVWQTPPNNFSPPMPTTMSVAPPSGWRILRLAAFQTVIWVQRVSPILMILGIVFPLFLNHETLYHAAPSFLNASLPLICCAEHSRHVLINLSNFHYFWLVLALFLAILIIQGNFFRQFSLLQADTQWCPNMTWCHFLDFECLSWPWYQSPAVVASSLQLFWVVGTHPHSWVSGWCIPFYFFSYFT
jgi:hypothetical protein